MLVAQHTIMRGLEEVRVQLHYGRNNRVHVAKRPLVVASFVALVECTASDAACSSDEALCNGS